MEPGDGGRVLRWLLRLAVLASLIFAAVQLAQRPTVTTPAGQLRCDSWFDYINGPAQEFHTAAERDACHNSQVRIERRAGIVFGVVFVVDIVVAEIIFRGRGASR
ncbi:MAG: hypothetical protein JWO37_1009 [Acidimicrobiales bacterium]|nr:hypothetical protein [Acidimicrobiales bacterium]